MSKETPNIDFDTFGFFCSQIFGDFSQKCFDTLSWRRPGQIFLDFLGISGSERLETPVFGGSDCKDSRCSELIRRKIKGQQE